MSLQITNATQFESRSREEIYAILVEYLPQLQTLSKRLLAEAYTSTFGRNPIDTGASKKNTITFGESNLRPYPYVKQVFESLQMFPFIYFAEPLQPKNPNYKYGKRNVLISARDRLAEQLGL